MKINGFSAAAVKAGIRYQDRLDLALIYSEVPAVAAGVFTTNKVKAAPLLLDMERLGQGKAQAVLVNSGNANACNGRPGHGRQQWPRAAWLPGSWVSMRSWSRSPQPELSASR